MTQHLYFDPTDEGTGTQLDVMAGVYEVDADSFSAPAPAPEFATAGSMDTEGEDIAGRKHQNRRVALTTRVVETTVAARDAAVDVLAEKASKIFRDGGTLRYVKADGSYRTLDLLAADSYEPAFDVTYSLGQAATLSMSFVAKPYARGPEQSLGTFSETTLPALTLTVNNVPGDVPGLGRLVVTDDSGNAQRLLIWGIQSRYYAAAASAGLFFQAESLTMDAGVVTADGTASGGSMVRFTGTGTTTWDVSFAAVNKTHIGAFRVIVRAKASVANGSVRAYWSSQGPDVYTTNAAAPLLNNAWHILDLGVVTPGSAIPAGQPWTLNIEAAEMTGETLDIDWVMLVPVTEGSGQAEGYFTASRIAPSGVTLIAANGDFTLRHDAALKGPNGSGQYSPAFRYEGDYLLIPAGYDTARMIVKTARAADSRLRTDLGIDDISAELFVTPRYLSLL